MNLDRGVFRIWLVIVPICWAISVYVNFDDISSNPFKLGYCPENEIWCTYRAEGTTVMVKSQYNSYCADKDTFFDIEKTYCGREFFSASPLKSKGIYFNKFDTIEECKDFASKATLRETIKRNTDKDVLEFCIEGKRNERNELVIYLFILFVTPLLLYPFYYLVSRTIFWISRGFKNN